MTTERRAEMNATFQETLRPIVVDAAESLSYYREDVDVSAVTEWYDKEATIEDIQHGIMGAVQDAVLRALKLPSEADVVARRTPGTEYLRRGPNNDPLGRLADFARFVETETREILDALDGVGNGYHERRARQDAHKLIDVSSELGGFLSGYTTAAD